MKTFLQSKILKVPRIRGLNTPKLGLCMQRRNADHRPRTCCQVLHLRGDGRAAQFVGLYPSHTLDMQEAVKAIRSSRKHSLGNLTGRLCATDFSHCTHRL